MVTAPAWQTPVPVALAGSVVQGCIFSEFQQAVSETTAPKVVASPVAVVLTMVTRGVQVQAWPPGHPTYEIWCFEEVSTRVMGMERERERERERDSWRQCVCVCV